MTAPTLCQHNTLRRQCPICERDDEIARLRSALLLADAAADSLHHMGDFWAYGWAKAEDAEPTQEDYDTVAEISKRARIALDAYRAARKALAP